MTKKNRVIVLILVLFLSFSTSGFSKFELVESRSSDLSEPSQSFISAPLDRLGSGFSNVIYGPFEMPYQVNEEIKRTDPIRGAVPGVLRGLGWCITRELVGVFEIVTFLVPLRPHLKPFNTDWMRA